MTAAVKTKKMNQSEDNSEIFHDALETQTLKIDKNQPASIEFISKTLEKVRQVKSKLQAKKKHELMVDLLEDIENKLDDEICKNIIIEETQTSIFSKDSAAAENHIIVVEKAVDLKPSSKMKRKVIQNDMNFDKNVTIK